MNNYCKDCRLRFYALQLAGLGAAVSLILIPLIFFFGITLRLQAEGVIMVALFLLIYCVVMEKIEDLLI